MTRARLLARPARGPEAVAHALRSGQATALGWLRPAPRDAAGWALEAEAAARVPAPLASAAWEAVAQRQEALGGPGAASANARLLGRAGTLAVVTGQQPGLLGGPLMTWHKAAGAVHLARHVARLTGRPTVPVFWLASEDHDLEEANQATLLDRDGQPRVLSLPLELTRRSLADVQLPSASVEALVTQAAACLSDTPRAREALTLCAPRAGEGFAEPFARVLAHLLGGAGLVILDVRTIAPWLGPAFASLVRDGATLTRVVRASAPTLRAAGFQAPLDPRADDLPLFLRAEPGGPRARLGATPEGQALRDGRALGCSTAELAERVAAEPMLASPDVVGRVWLQNRILPVLAYLAGPSELAYQAQVAAAAEALGARFPLALPRPAALWLDARAEDSAAAFGRSIEEVLDGALPAAQPTGEALRRLLAEEDARLRARAAEVATIAAGRSPSGAPACGPLATRALATGFERVVASLARERAALEAALEADAGVASGRWVRLTNLVRPRGRPQERVLGLLTLLARYGREALLAGLAALDALADGLWLLGADVPASAPPTPAPPAPPPRASPVATPPVSFPPAEPPAP